MNPALSFAASVALLALARAQDPALPAGVTVAIVTAIERGQDWLVRSQHAGGG